MLLFVDSIDVINCIITRTKIYMKLKIVKHAFYLSKFVKICQNKLLSYYFLLNAKTICCLKFSNMNYHQFECRIYLH